MNESSTDSTDSKSEQCIIPTDNDVLCGRGAGTLNHRGNTIYRGFVEEKKIEYLTRHFKREKRQIANEIVEKIRNLDPPGRFLVHDDEHGEWHDIGDVKARDKTLQALREDAPKVRKKMEEENAAMMAQLAQQARQMQEDAQRNAQARAIADTEFRDRGFDFSSKSPSPPSTTTEQFPPSNEHSPAPSFAMHAQETATSPVRFPPYPVHAHAIPPTYIYPYPYPPPGVPILSPHPPPTGSMPPESVVCRDDARQFGYHTPHFGYYGLPHYYMQPLPPPHTTVAPPPTRQIEYRQAHKGHTIAKGSKYKYQGK